jgi:hypothetical protein
MVRYREQVPGDVAAQHKWLAAHRPDRFGRNPVPPVDFDEHRTSAELRADMLLFLIENGLPLKLPPGLSIEGLSRIAGRDVGDATMEPCTYSKQPAASSPTATSSTCRAGRHSEKQIPSQ